MIMEAALAVALMAGPAQQAAVIPQEARAFAACVSERESHGNYKARGSDSSSAGRWQFLDNEWRRGLAYMVKARLVRFGMSKPQAERVRVELTGKHIARWQPAYQDAGFIAVLNARGPFSGAHHWYLAGSRCNKLGGM